MSHKPENNPLVRIRKELTNIHWLTNLAVPDVRAVNTRLRFLSGYVDMLETEQLKLKRAFRTQALKANMAGLREQFLLSQVERLETQRRHDLRLIHELTVVVPPVPGGTDA